MELPELPLDVQIIAAQALCRYLCESEEPAERLALRVKTAFMTLYCQNSHECIPHENDQEAG
jgi:hypothetical protein